MFAIAHAKTKSWWYMARINIYLVTFPPFEIVLSLLLRHKAQEQPNDRTLFTTSQLH